MNLKVFRATGVLFHVSLLVTFLGQKSLKTLRMFALSKASWPWWWVLSTFFQVYFPILLHLKLYILNVKVVYLHVE